MQLTNYISNSIFFIENSDLHNNYIYSENMRN